MIIHCSSEVFNIIFLTFYESSAKQPVRFLLDFKVFQFIFMPTLQSVTHKHFNKALVCFFLSFLSVLFMTVSMETLHFWLCV